MKLLVVALAMILSSGRASAESDGPDPQTPAEVQAARARVERDFKRAVEPSALNPPRRLTILGKYDYVDPTGMVPKDLLSDALIFFDLNRGGFTNQDYIAIVNFKPRSDEYRLFVINMKDGSVERFRTTHGGGSDPDRDGIATIFGNEIDSGKSSLGFVRTAEAYDGRFGRSIRLDGLSSTNDNMRVRAVVFHGWEKVKEANVLQPRSRGCITTDVAVKDAILEKIKEGALMYVGLTKL